jgi:hypothetical protein
VKLANATPTARKLVGLANDVEPVQGTESKPAQRAKTSAAKAWVGPSGTLSRFCVVRGA